MVYFSKLGPRQEGVLQSLVGGNSLNGNFHLFSQAPLFNSTEVCMCVCCKYQKESKCLSVNFTIFQKIKLKRISSYLSIWYFLYKDHFFRRSHKGIRYKNGKRMREERVELVHYKTCTMNWRFSAGSQVKASALGRVMLILNSRS